MSKFLRWNLLELLLSSARHVSIVGKESTVSINNMFDILYGLVSDFNTWSQIFFIISSVQFIVKMFAVDCSSTSDRFLYFTVYILMNLAIGHRFIDGKPTKEDIWTSSLSNNISQLKNLDRVDLPSIVSIISSRSAKSAIPSPKFAVYSNVFASMAQLSFVF